MLHRYMLNCTNNALLQATELFDFIWPTALAMWNFRAQAIGYTIADKEMTNEKLANRFSSNDKTINRAYVTKYCDTQWDDHKTYLSKILLGEICSIYDAWCNDMIHELQLNNCEISQLYSPSQYTHALYINKEDISSFMLNNVYPKLINNKKYNYPKTKEMLTCFKYFKECRNSFMHNGGKATDRVIKWQEKFKKITDIGAKEIPEFFPTKLNEKIKLSLRGVVGFADIVTRTITSFDAETSKCKHAELLLASRIKNKHYGDILPKDDEKLTSKLTRWTNSALSISNTPRITISTTDAIDFATRHKLARHPI